MSTLHTTDLFAVHRGTKSYKVSYKDILAGIKLPSALEYKGVVNPTKPAPSPSGGLQVGMVYVLSPSGTIHASWTGVAGLAATDGQLALWEGAKWELMGDTGFTQPDATETVKGIAEIATTAEVTAGTDNERIVTPAKLKAYVATNAPTPPTATETIKGIVELATAAETTTGTDAHRAVHPKGLKVELDKKLNKNIALLPALP
jgi:hypothetical protein